jgi:RNA polymerase sigma-70 factor (ECF subfamily)
VRSDVRRPAPPSVEDVFERDARRLWWSILASTGDREVAHDAVAEAFAQALRRGDALRDPAAWVWRTAFAVARGELKRRNRSRPLEDEPTTMPEPVGLFDALARLSPKQRAVVVLHHYAGYRLHEIARMLGITKGTAGVHLSRGRRRLREVLEERDG